MKKILAIALSTLMAVSVMASVVSAEAPTEQKQFKIGICQLVQHVALDAASQGFMDAIVEELGEDGVVFDYQDASGDSATCATIVNSFVSGNYDLILANATAPLQAAAQATADIPILGTSITDYASALEIKDWSGKTGYNVSGTSDLAPLADQAAMIKELFPDVKKVGIIYCSAEANSVYQADVITEELTNMGIEVTSYAFTDTNDAATIAQNACDNVEVIYIPTDNAAASNTGIFDQVCRPAGIPIVCGEEGLCKGCGVATLSISYYDIGYTTGKMAIDILVNGADITQMDVQYAPQVTKEFNEEICKDLGITVPEDYVAIAME
ncbi:MAG: ABC transporter substrate-binding protein [Parasporobacterium sp.]|nr:ABC transporter substrate-binding protein [Parasporobacterium sp.]